VLKAVYYHPLDPQLFPASSDLRIHSRVLYGVSRIKEVKDVVPDREMHEGIACCP